MIEHKQITRNPHAPSRLGGACCAPVRVRLGALAGSCAAATATYGGLVSVIELDSVVCHDFHRY